METFFIEPSEYNPKVHFDPQKKVFEISGTSRPEDVVTFYEPILMKVDKFVSELLEENSVNELRSFSFKLVFNLDYINSASSKYILQIIDTFKRIYKQGIEVNVDWYYDDEDDQILEDGQDLSEVIQIPFNFIQR